MPLPRVGVLCAISGLGGAEFSLLELVAHLRGSYEFHLIVPGEGALKEKAEAAGAKVWMLPWPEALAGAGETQKRVSAVRMLRSAACVRRFARQLSRVLDQIRPSVVVTNSAKAHVIGSLARRKKNVPLIWYMRDGLEERRISRKVLAMLSRRCDVTVCISRYVAAQFRKYVSASVPANVVYNIVDLSRFRPGATPPADWRRKQDEVWFGIIAPITPLKGHDIFLDAAERVLGEMPNAMFAVVGNNPYMTEASSLYEELLRKRVEKSPLRERVKFVGFRTDVPSVLAHLDVLVQPNRGPEGLGRSVLEAMACGVPVIAVNKWGPAELIQDGRTGLLFPPLDTRRLAEQMIRLGRDRDLRTSIGKNGHDWIQDNLVSKDLAGKFEQVLDNAIASQQQEAVA